MSSPAVLVSRADQATRSTWVAVNEAAAIRRAAAHVTGLAQQLHDRDHLPPAIRDQVDVAADELRRAAAACAELLDLAAGVTR